MASSKNRRFSIAHMARVVAEGPDYDGVYRFDGGQHLTEAEVTAAKRYNRREAKRAAYKADEAAKWERVYADVEATKERFAHQLEEQVPEPEPGSFTPRDFAQAHSVLFGS